MIGKRYKIFGSLHRVFSLLAAFFVLFLLGACAGGNYGTLVRDRDLDNQYLNYEVLPDHRYYITGGYGAPSAILAINKDYELENSGNLWVPVPNVDSGQMRKWMETIAPEQNYRWSNAYFAAYILDPTGKRVGAWYAIESQTTVKFLEGNKIQVYTPTKNPNLQLERGLRRGGVL